MAVYRVQRTKDYTVMSNHHLKDKSLTLKAKGLLSVILSLPDEWNYTTRGLAAICKEGVDAVGSALKELESTGYIVRNRLRGPDGRILDTEYLIYEEPVNRTKPDAPPPFPCTEKPDTGDPEAEDPCEENPAELKIQERNTQKSRTKGSTDASLLFRGEAAEHPPEPKRREAVSLDEMENYRALIRENIGYGYLKQERPLRAEELDEIVEILVETVCAKRKYTRVAGSDFPQEVVKARLLKLTGEHIRFVMDGMKENTTKIRNIKQYLLAALFNAPATIGNYYSALVNHNAYGEL